MYFQYPLESLARRRSSRKQMEFARQAKISLVDTDEVVSRPFAEGLVLFAANEGALAATDGTANTAIRLARYKPVPADFGPGAA